MSWPVIDKRVKPDASLALRDEHLNSLALLSLRGYLISMSLSCY